MKKLIHKVFGVLLAVSAISAASAQSRKVDVWDFGGVAENGANNHISIADIDALDGIAKDGKFVAGEYVFGDLTLKTDNNDRAYYDGKKNYGTQGYAAVTFDDGYASNGIYYCNGKGGVGKRYMLVKNVKAGDVITFYARISNSGDEKIHFASVGDDGNPNGVQDEVAPLEAKSARYSYIASSDGSYKVYADATVGKPVYYRLVRTPAVEISGNLASLPAGKPALKFVVQDTKQEIPAVVNGKSYKAGLAAGHSYTAVLTEIKGYGISADTKLISLAADVKGSLKKDLTVAEQKTYTVSGKVKGVDAGYDGSKMKILMAPPAGSVFQEVECEVNGEKGNFTFKGELEPSVIYTASLAGANDYSISGKAEFEGTTSYEKDIEVALKPVYEIAGKFFGEVSSLPAKISFKNIDDGYVYDGSVSGDSYSAKLRDGKYEVEASTDKASTMNHVVVAGKNVSKDIKMTAKDNKVQPLPLKKDIYVGGKKADYATVKEAVAAASAMAPKSEEERITIHIAPGTYRAQLIINTPYITLKNDSATEEVKLTWYYGIAYNYYSADAKGYYDEDRAYDKFEKKGVARWGVANYIQKGATGFHAEGITFETSFNKYVTDEEIADGVEPDGSLNFVRKLNSDVRSKKATERSAALCTEADKAEFLNCKFLGLQDTLYTGTGTNTYFRKCFIEGNTDFIFGDGDAVFENCEISWCGYTDVKQGGYLTAARNAVSKGYLFYNCVISADTSVMQSAGFLGRPWGPSAKVAFVNTVFGNDSVIMLDGWTSMSGNGPDKANFREFNSLWDGKAVDLSARIHGTVLSSEKGYTPADFFGEWKPVYYTEPVSGAAKLKKGSFTTDDDMNTPYPGHTITLHYSLGKLDSEDNSLIRWYRVNDGKETLVKQSAGYADKTYLIQKEDSGSNIMAVITPIIRGGKAGKDVVVKLPATIKEGYAVPSKGAVNRPRTAGAVNVFLAGDSTVKDYSADGMWQAGQIRNEGAWGEFLQCFFNNAVAVQNYANGGRSTRNFINEGSLAKIAENIGKGDYLFIQFGHNDCHNETGYLEDRFVPLGIPDAKGIYPTIEGKKVATPDSYASKYGPEFYSWGDKDGNCNGTFKWYLKQYIDVARNAGATPVLVTPVSRKYFDKDGKIRPHHDSENEDKKHNPAAKYVTKNNAYVEAYRQLAKEEKVLLIDGFEITKAIYEKAYADFAKEEKPADRQKKAVALMFPGDSTHNNKLGGFILAGEMAKAIKTQIPALGNSIVHPTKAIGENSDGKIMFTVDSNGKFSCDDDYWTAYEQKVLDSIK